MKKNQTLIMFILFVSGLVIMMNLYLTIPLTKSISNVFHISGSQAGLLSSLFSLGFAIGCLIYGVLSEKFGRKRVIMTGIVCLTAITLLIGLTYSFHVILLLRFLQGAAAATFSPAALAFAGEFFEGSTKTTAIGLISTGFLMAGILGQILATSINNYFSFQMVFIVMAILLLLVSIGLFFILPNHQGNKPNLSVIKSFSHIGKIFKQVSLVFCYLIAFFLLMSFVIMYQLLMHKLSTPPFNLIDSELLLIRLFGLIGMLFSPLAGTIAKRLTVKKLLTYALGITTISSLLLAISNSVTSMIIFSVLFVLGIALAVPSLISLVNLLGAFERGLAVSIYTFVLFLGTSVAPLIGQYLINSYQSNMTFVILGIIILIPMTISLFIQVENK